ncbi:MAG: serine/threonine-protein kinase [Chloroflexota bacterium]
MTPSVGDNLGPYRLVERLGAGGMGTVYRAIHRRLNRPRAVKVLPSNLADDPTFIARFEREARLAAGLEHPNIVRVYDVGDQDGAYYIAMELLSGRSLRRVLRDDRPLTVERVLALLRQLAAALDFAHGQGVVHRDVKPDNATVDAHDHLTLVDFGLARAADGTSLTRNNVMGTVEYMAPEVLLEQPAGPHGESGDLYALGITAYELLVGRMPFTGTISAKIIHDQLHTPPPSPRALNPSLPQAAEAVILRQLSKRPSERYVTAGAFVDALTASLGTSDSRDPSSELDEDRRRDQIEALRALAGRLLDQGDWRSADAVIGQLRALGASDTAELSRRAEALRASAERDPISDWGIRRSDDDGGAKRSSHGDADDAEDRQRPLPRRTWARPGWLTLAIAVLVVGGLAALWWQANTPSGRIGTTATTAVAPAAASSPAAGPGSTSAGSPTPVMAASPAPLQVSRLVTLRGHDDDVYSVAFSPDGQYLASAADDGAVKLWRANDGAPVRTLQDRGADVTGLAFSPDSRTVAAASSDKTVKLWRASDSTLVQTLRGHADVVSGVAFSPDGGTLASASGDKTVKLWQLGDGTVLRTLGGYQNPVESVAFSPDGQTVASGATDQTVTLWRASDGVLLRTLVGHGDLVRSVAFSPDGQTVASGGDDGTVKLWRASDGHLLRNLLRDDQPVPSGGTPGSAPGQVAEPDGSPVVLASANGDVSLSKMQQTDRAVLSVAFSPDGQLVAAGVADSTVRLWRVSDGAQIESLLGHGLRVNGVAFSPDGRTLASASSDRTIVLWRLTR